MRLAVIAVLLGYVLPSYSILKRMGNQRDEITLTSLKLDGLGAVSPVVAKELASSLGSSWSSGELSLTATFLMKFPGRCRLELSSPETAKSLAVVWNNAKKRSEGPEFAAAQAGVDELCAFLSPRSANDGETRANLDRHLKSLKVDTQQVALGRFEGTTVFIIGDKKEGSPQVWVYKDRFLPARVRYTDDKGTAWDVRFIDYTSQATADWFPRQVEVLKGTEPHLRLMVLGSETRPEIEQSKF